MEQCGSTRDSLDAARAIARSTAAYRGVALAAAAAAGAGAGGAAMPASADIVYFENPPPGTPGHFAWRPSSVWDPPYYYEYRPESWLDVKKPPHAQGGSGSLSSVAMIWKHIGHPNLPLLVTQYVASVAHIRQHFSWGAEHSVTEALSRGASINGQDFGQYSAHVVSYFGIPHSQFELGRRAYIGLKTGAGQYGWIAVTRVSANRFVAFSWAYETEPGAPIRAGEIPAPGTLALLAFGAAAANTRKRTA
jgi:hypothetical protein